MRIKTGRVAILVTTGALALGGVAVAAPALAGSGGPSRPSRRGGRDRHARLRCAGMSQVVCQTRAAASAVVRQIGGRWNQRRASKSGVRPVGPSSMSSGCSLITSAAWRR